MGVMDKISARLDAVAKAEPAAEPAEGLVADVVADAAPAAQDMPAPEADAVAEAPPLAPDPKAALRQKLNAAKADRQARIDAREEAARARQLREQAERDAAAARQERERYEGLREGSFKEVLTTLGRDPRKTFEEMQREAVEAGTPEGQIRRLEQTVMTRLEAMEKASAERIERLEEERKRAAQREESAAFTGHFQRAVIEPGYEILREAYDDEALLGYASALKSNRDQMLALARQHGVRLTNPSRGFLMREILDVLKAVQVDYDSQRKARAERLRGAKPAPKVNGTTGQKHSAGAIDNDLASARVLNGSARLSKAERIQREIDRLEGR